MTDNLIKGKIVPVVVYNPTSWPRTEWLDIPVAGQVQGTSTMHIEYVANDFETVFDQGGNPVPFQTYTNIRNIATVAFQAQIPAQGFNTYFIAPASTSLPEAESKVTKAFGGNVGDQYKLLCNNMDFLRNRS